MLIAIVAVLHVLVSHYAVGGGIFLAVETRYAYRTGDRDYLGYLRRHAGFFILLTVVYGAITGVGIWWTIGLASPLATETLIHIFVFGWAMEYVFFVLEIASAFIFYYYWGRLDEETHQTIGWIYAAAAWISLVLITGITSFMLHSGSWPERGGFWVAFFNPQFVPQVLARTGAALLLASLYVDVHASLVLRDERLRCQVARRSAMPAILGCGLAIAGGLGWYAFLPESAKAALLAASALNVFMALITALGGVLLVMLYVGPYRHPEWLSPGFALLLLGAGLAVMTTGEFVREAVRKPYVVYNVVMGNQVLAAEAPAVRRRGAFESGTWTKAYLRRHHPGLIATNGEIDERRFLTELTREEQARLGQVLFQYNCNGCHAADLGFSAATHLLRGWDEGMIQSLAERPEKYQFFMPPWTGTVEEARLLTRYLVELAPPSPDGMFFGQEPQHTPPTR
jgi:hypothetical protein